MKRLSHPIRAIREPFGKAGLTVAICALVLAMVGGAYAAGGLTKSQEKQVTKIAKKYAGKNGATGPAGPQGPAGTNGKDGSNGSNGANGQSVTSKELKKGEGGCVEGGAEFTSASGKASACNGKPGSPWTAGGTLPKGATEKGAWAVDGMPVNIFSSFEGQMESISFGIPLRSAPTPHIIGPGEGAGEGNENPAIVSGECTGTAVDPGAAEGQFCIFREQSLDNNVKAAITIEPGAGTAAQAGPTGAVLLVFAENSAAKVQSLGTWAVTAGE
jgi:hypothetical protein